MMEESILIVVLILMVVGPLFLALYTEARGNEVKRRNSERIRAMLDEADEDPVALSRTIRGE